jgi:hypothetical protein
VKTATGKRQNILAIEGKGEESQEVLESAADLAEDIAERT